AGAKAPPFYWVVLADSAGAIVFSEASFEDNPDTLDGLIDEATAKAAGQNWWVVLIQCVATHPPSAHALAWLNSCGVPDVNWSPSGVYPLWPAQMVAIGKTGSPGFPGRVATARFPTSADHEHEVQEVSAGLPFNVGAV